MSYHIRSGFVFLFLFFPKQLQNVSRAESSSDEVLTDAEPDLEEQPPTDDLELRNMLVRCQKVKMKITRTLSGVSWKKQLKTRTVETTKKRTLPNPKILYGRNVQK